MKISKDFSMSEMIYSATAEKEKILNIPSIENEECIKELVVNVLQPLRDLYGDKINITSGFRCKELNTRLGGAKHSDHMIGCAADIVCSDLDLLFKLALTLPDFNQLIMEDLNGRRWLHISYRKSFNKNEVLLFKDGIYTKYLTI